MSTPPTIQSVAARAGVAASTVSRVLNGGQSSPAARARVESAVRALGYVPSATARNLKLGRTGIVGLAGASVQAPWFMQLLGGMERVLRVNGASVAIASLEVDGRYDPSPVESWLLQRTVDAIALVRPGARERELGAAAARAGIAAAFVLPDVEFASGLEARADNVQGGYLAGKHLLDLGHQRFAFYGGPADSVDAQDRLRGLRQALAEARLELPDDQVAFLDSYQLEAGLVAAERWRQRRPSTAVVLGNDAIALGFVRGLREHGIEVPRDVSVIGFDGIAEGEYAWPPLTTVAQPTQLMGADTARFLLRPFASAEPAHRLDYRLELLVRSSTARPAKRP